MASLTTLLHEHQALRQISRVIRDQVDRRHCDIVEVTRLRFEFANMIRAHLASEHRHLLSRLECEDRIRIGAYDEVLKDATDLRLAYSTHVRTWTRQAVQELERKIILNVLEANHWNRKRTASELRISYRALLYKIRQAGLPPKRVVRRHTVPEAANPIPGAG